MVKVRMRIIRPCLYADKVDTAQFICIGCESIGECMCLLRVSVWVGDLVLSNACDATCGCLWVCARR